MEWISRVVRSAGGRLQVRVTRGAEAEEVVDLASVRARLDVQAPDRAKATVRLDALSQRSARPFLELLGTPWTSDAGQPVYEARTDKATWLVPAQLLILSLFGTHRELRDRILTPLPPTALAGVLAQVKTGTARANTLDWIARDPSAAAAWSSVYQNALVGRFDFTAPQATATFSARGRLQEGQLLVTQLRLLNLEARRSDAAVDHRAPRRSSHSIRTTSPLATDTRLRRLTEPPHLTDQAWVVLAPLVERPRTDRRGVGRSHDYRELVDVMLLKLARGLPWADMSGDRRVIRRASELYPHLVRSGVLDRAVNLTLGCS